MALFKRDASKKIPDRELIERYRNSRDSAYMGQLFQRYTHLVFGICMKYLKDETESEDAVMEVFEKLLSELKRHNIDHFKGWLYSVTKNHCLMKLRKQKKERKKKSGFQKSTDQHMEKAEFLHLNDVEVKEKQLNRLEAAVEQLSTEQKECIKLFYFKERSYKEIAETTNYSLKQVKSYLQNGKRNLKNYLTTQQDERSKRT